MAAKNLLICFDAFGTLFTPKRPIMQQYAEVARGLGLSGFTDEQVGAAFKKAFKQEATQNPNYGHATGLGAEKWWTNIITSTFRQVISPTQKLPDQLVPKLLHRFWSKEGYLLYPDVLPLLRRIREHSHSAERAVVVGVITNSDDRVPDILRSFDLQVADRRYGRAPDLSTDIDPVDIEFVVMSYDVGHEKPDRHIFDATVEILSSILTAHSLPLDVDSNSWDKVYVGDEYSKDVVGAVAAGWKAVLIEREETVESTDIYRPGDKQETLFEAFEKSQALGFTSLQSLADHIPV